MVGAEFRRLRHERGETLDDVAKRAGVSSQYLSEMERGVKDPSSEMIAAVARALGISLLDLTRAIFSSLVNDDGVSNANERHVTACATGRHSSQRLLALDSRHVVAVVPSRYQAIRSIQSLHRETLLPGHASNWWPETEPGRVVVVQCPRTRCSIT